MKSGFLFVFLIKRKEEVNMTNEEIIEAIVIILHKCKSNSILRDILHYILKKVQ